VSYTSWSHRVVRDRSPEKAIRVSDRPEYSFIASPSVRYRTNRFL